MSDLSAEPIAHLARIIFAAWGVIGFFVLLYSTPVVRSAITGKSYDYPRWWLRLLVAYISSLVLVTMVLILNGVSAEMLLRAYGLALFFITPLAFIITLIGAVVVLFFRLIIVARKTDKTEFKEMLKRTSYVFGVVGGLWLILTIF